MTKDENRGIIKMNVTKEKTKTEQAGTEKERKEKERSVEETLDQLLNMVWRDPILWESICACEWCNRRRIEVLCGIVKQALQENWEVTETDIFRYGSMIQKEDLAARQIFQWLLRMSGKKTPSIPCHHQEKGIL